MGNGEIWGGLGGLAGNNGFAIEFGGRVEKITGSATIPSAATRRLI